MSFFGEISVYVFIPFFKLGYQDFFVFLLLSCRSYLCILEINSLSDIRFLKYFLPFHRLPFTLLFFGLMKSHLLIFYCVVCSFDVISETKIMRFSPYSRGFIFYVEVFNRQLNFVDCISVLVAQSCLTLCDPTDRSPQGIFVHEILQARILEWVAIFLLQVIVYDSLFLCVHFLTCGFSIFSGSFVKELILSHSIFFTQLSKVN